MIRNGKYHGNSTDDRIKEIVASLSHDKWFEGWSNSKKDAFKKLCAPGDNFFYVNNTPEGWEEYLQTLTDEERYGSSNNYYDEIVEIEGYCYSIKYSVNGNSGEDVANKIIEIIEGMINKSNPSPVTIKALIKHVKVLINEQVKELSAEANDPEYARVLAYFENKCNYKIHNHFLDRIQDLELLETIDQIQQGEAIQTINKVKAEPLAIVNTRPIFKKEAIEQIYDILKDYFIGSDQKQLHDVLDTGSSINNKLHFISNGNRLADAFKQLYDGSFITGCKKKELEKWVSQNFTFQDKNKVKHFTLRYLQDIISSSWSKCENPIIAVTQSKTTGDYFITKS